VQGVEVPLPDAQRAGEQFHACKISKRFDSDISAVSAGMAIRLDDSGIARDVRLAFGGMAAIVKRAVAAEKAILGQPWNEATLSAAVAALSTDFKPLTDMRASAAYRAQVAGNLLRRFWLQTRKEQPLAESVVSVFARPGAAASASTAARV
jgi:xanthine dehydrogenase small subunit